MGGNYFEGDDGVQNTLVFQVKGINFRREVNVGNGNTVIRHDVWKSKGSSDQGLNYSVNNGALTAKLIRPTHVVFGADEYLFPDRNKIITKNLIVNIYIVYKLSLKSITTSNALKNDLFGGIKVNRPNNTTNPHEYIYSGYGIGFNHTGVITHSEGNLARNVIIFGVDMSRSVHGSNKTQNILVSGRAFIQKINNTTIYAEKMYLPNFSVENKILF